MLMFLFRILCLFVVCFSEINVWALEFNKEVPDEEELLAEAVRIKDIIAFQGIRDNILLGYGLVVGLNASGDNLTNSVFTQQELENFLGKLGVNARGAKIKTKNLAAVTVTATLPPFARQGSRVDIKVSAVGDATSLEGGTLLATPLLGADGAVYAVSQGSVSISSIDSKGAQAKDKSVKTVGFIPSGAIVEREIDFALNDMEEINMALHNPDISTASRVADAVNLELGGVFADAIDPGTVVLEVPQKYHGNVLELLAKIEQAKVFTDSIAKVIIDEASGTVIIGKDVRIDTIAVAQGNLMIEVKNKYNFVKKGQAGEDIVVMEKGNSLQELVNGLNMLGAGPRDIIGVIQSAKKIGALQADIIVN